MKNAKIRVFKFFVCLIIFLASFIFLSQRGGLSALDEKATVKDGYVHIESDIKNGKVLDEKKYTKVGMVIYYLLKNDFCKETGYGNCSDEEILKKYLTSPPNDLGKDGLTVEFGDTSKYNIDDEKLLKLFFVVKNKSGKNEKRKLKKLDITKEAFEVLKREFLNIAEKCLEEANKGKIKADVNCLKNRIEIIRNFEFNDFEKEKINFGFELSKVTFEKF